MRDRDGNRTAAPDRLVRLELEGFKSFRDRTSVEIRPLTILAGRNSSGKSSLVQPLLLMKQTLESSHDPGALELSGPCVTFTQADQLLWTGAGENPATQWTCTLTVERGTPGSPLERNRFSVTYSPGKRGGIELASTRIDT
ncbi:MAG: AAA family ATPase, partial [Balneolales bacterium]|nr:AAA family ATPase [Balneolales bacterium]